MPSPMNLAQAARSAAARPAAATTAQLNAERLHAAVDDAHQVGTRQGYRRGYVAGTRFGILIGAGWGLVVWLLVLCLAAELGWLNKLLP